MFLSASLVAIVLLYVFSTDALATSSLHPPKVSLEFDWDSIEQVIAFGDSYTFVLGTAGHVNYSFIGDYLDLSFTPEELLANEIVPSKTSSGGGNWIEFLTGCTGGSPLDCDKQLWDFAFAGADIDGTLLPLHHDYTTPLVDQVAQWKSYAYETLEHSENKTMAMWWIGINDTNDAAQNSSIPVGDDAFWRAELSSFFNAVKVVYDVGIKTHLFLNVPPEELSPNSLGNPTRASTVKGHSDYFNRLLEEYISTFSANHTDSIPLLFDSNAWFHKILSNAKEYGFTNTTAACQCPEGDSEGYFWFDGGHPTEPVHKLLADAIKDFLSGVA